MKRIHVNQNVIRHNKAYGNKLPAIRVEHGLRTVYCMEVRIKGESTLVYRPDSPLPCGAKLWIETEADVEYIDPVSYKDIKKLADERRELILGEKAA